MKKKIAIAIIAVLVLAALVIAGMVYYNVAQTGILVEEVNALSELDLSKDEVDMTIKTKGDYAVVEKNIKEYLADYGTKTKEVIGIMENEQLVGVLSVENYKEDGPDFVKTKEYIQTTKQDFTNKMNELINMTSEETIMKKIEGQGLSQDYIDLYRDLMMDEEIAQELKTAKEELEKSAEQINTLLSVQEQVINLLANNKGKWAVNGEQIQFSSRIVLDKYNELVGSLQNL